MRLIFIIAIITLVFFAGDLVIAQNSSDSSDGELSVTVDADSLQQAENNSGIVFFGSNFIRDHQTIIYAILLFIVAFVVLMYLRQPIQRLSEKPGRYASLLRQIIPIFLTISWFLVLYIIVADILNPALPLTISILIILGFAAGLAFQDTLKDIIAGLIIPFEKHIEIGHKIRIGNIFGEIYRMGLREIELKLPDGNFAIFPSAYILKKSIRNIYLEKDNCPVVVDFYLPLNSDMDKCREIAYKATIISPYLYLDKPVNIRFHNTFKNGKSIIKMRIEAYLLKIEFQPMFSSELTECVMKELMPAAQDLNSR